MKKIIIFWLVISTTVMLALPWLTVTFVKGDAGMAVCFLLFFSVDPLYSGVTGVYGGEGVRGFWGRPGSTGYKG